MKSNRNCRDTENLSKNTYLWTKGKNCYKEDGVMEYWGLRFQVIQALLYISKSNSNKTMKAKKNKELMKEDTKVITYLNLVYFRIN
jgi:hypothetical protein